MTPVGKILKTKGYDGTTIVEFYYPVIGSDIRAFFVQKRSQTPTPLLIDHWQTIDEFTSHIRWQKYPSKEEAQSLHQAELHLDTDIAATAFDLDASTDDFIDYIVYLREERIGIVTQILDLGQQETMVVKLDSNDQEIMIPMHEHFIVTIDDDQEAIYVVLSDEYLETFTS